MPPRPFRKKPAKKNHGFLIGGASSNRRRWVRRGIISLGLATILGGLGWWLHGRRVEVSRVPSVIVRQIEEAHRNATPSTLFPGPKQPMWVERALLNVGLRQVVVPRGNVSLKRDHLLNALPSNLSTLTPGEDVAVTPRGFVSVGEKKFSELGFDTRKPLLTYGGTVMGGEVTEETIMSTLLGTPNTIFGVKMKVDASRMGIKNGRGSEVGEFAQYGVYHNGSFYFLLPSNEYLVASPQELEAMGVWLVEDVYLH